MQTSKDEPKSFEAFDKFVAEEGMKLEERGRRMSLHGKPVPKMTDRERLIVIGWLADNYTRLQRGEKG